MMRTQRQWQKRLQAKSKIFRLLLALSLSSCSHAPTPKAPRSDGKPLTSLCEIDFESRTCWVSRSKNKGFKFEEMEGLWFGINKADLDRIEATLNE